QIFRDDQVTILGRLDTGGWYLIQSPFGPGWVVARLGEVFDPGGVFLPDVAPPPPPTATPAPTIAITASANLNPAPNQNPSFSNTSTTSFELGGQVRSQNVAELMRTAGMTWVKEQVRWELGETADKAALGAINAAHAQGMKILVSSVGWSHEMGDFESYASAYADYLRGVAALNPDAIEVWNEPNIEVEWVAGQINGANYTRLLEKAYNAIKSVNPNVLVISAALAPTGFFGGGCAAGGCDDDIFLRQMAQAGAVNYMDCIGVHHNEGTVSPTQSSGDPRGSHHSYYFPSMVELYYNTFGGAKPLCFTEVGYISPEGYTGLPPNFAWGSGITVQNQAQWLSEAVQVARQSGRVRMLIVWNINFTTTDGNDPRGQFAIIRPDGTCPACISLGNVMQ
ncbi:MAG TPA: hypothetical protein VJZ27_13845, partial [Aggregatilineales bacterium]|nr:hypothetical protein [Aggregatilineales bacterium]